jgi:hypothetical protein
MSSAVLQRPRRQRPAGPFGREVCRPVDRDCSGAHNPGDRPDQQASGVESAVCVEARGRLTLDDLIAGTWDELSVCEVVCCPICGGHMTSRGRGAAPRADAPDGALHGDCVDCGTQLR